MKATSECIYARGKHGIKHVRRRIRAAIPCAYPARQTHILRSQGNTDMRDAKNGPAPRQPELTRHSGAKANSLISAALRLPPASHLAMRLA